LNAANKRTDLEIQRTALESRIEEVGAAKPSAEPDLAKELLEKREQLREVTLQVAMTPRRVLAVAGVY